MKIQTTRSHNNRTEQPEIGKRSIWDRKDENWKTSILSIWIFYGGGYGVPFGLAHGGGGPPLPGGVDIKGIEPAIAWSVANGLQQDLKCAMYPHAVQKRVFLKSKPSQVNPADFPGTYLCPLPMDPTYGHRLCHRGMHAHGRTSMNFLECRTLFDSQWVDTITLRYFRYCFVVLLLVP